MEAENFWKKIKAMLSDMGKSMEWMCRETGLPVQSMRNRVHENRFPNLEDTVKILEILHISLEDLCEIDPEGTGDISVSGSGDSDGFSGYVKQIKGVINIPVMDQVFSAGKGQFIPDNEEVSEYIAVPAELKKYGSKIAAAHVRGDSMEPTLYDGDTIICDRNGYDGNDGIYTVIYKGAGFVKRLQRTGEGVTILSDNSRYAPMYVTSESSDSEDFRVLGKVRYVLHRL